MRIIECNRRCRSSRTAALGDGSTLVSGLSSETTSAAAPHIELRHNLIVVRHSYTMKSIILRV